MTNFHWDEAKKKIFFLKKNQNGRPKKTEIFDSPNSQNFFMKMSWIVHRVSRFDWCKGLNLYGCEAVRYKLKNGLKNKKCIFCLLCLFYVGQPHDHIGWTTSMPFASINPINPRTNPWNFHEKNLRIEGVENLSLFFCFIPMKISQHL